MSGVLGLKKKKSTFYGGISVFINKAPKNCPEKEIILTFLLNIGFINHD